MRASWHCSRTAPRSRSMQSSNLGSANPMRIRRRKVGNGTCPRHDGALDADDEDLSRPRHQRAYSCRRAGSRRWSKQPNNCWPQQDGFPPMRTAKPALSRDRKRIDGTLPKARTMRTDMKQHRHCPLTGRWLPLHGDGLHLHFRPEWKGRRFIDRSCRTGVEKLPVKSVHRGQIALQI